MLCTGHREFGTNRMKFCRSKMLYILDNVILCVYDVYFDCGAPIQSYASLVYLGRHASRRMQSCDRIPSTTPGAEPPRDARDSGSARSHSTHLETSSSDRPKWSPTRSSTRYQDQISVKCTRRTLRMTRFTRAAHAQPSLSNFPRRDSNFGERTRSRGTTLGERNFPTSPQNKKTKLTHCSIYVPMRTISTSHAK